MTKNGKLAGRILGCLSGLGIETFVVCAGARNAPLVTSLLGCDSELRGTIHHCFDERTASFFALGLAKKTERPVAILTTSGTAVAELLPSAVEAYYSGIPLVFVSADRPESYRGSGAPQAIEQKGIFGPYAPTAFDVTDDVSLDELASWNRSEPLHLNVCFEEPKPADAITAWEPISIPTPKLTDVDAGGVTAFLERGKTLVILGELPAPWQAGVEQLLRGAGAPVWAEATSGLRESSALQAQMLSSEKAISSLSFDRVLRIGGVPSLRLWRDLEERDDLDVLSVSCRRFTGLARSSEILVGDQFPLVTQNEETQPCWVNDLTLLSPARLNGLLEKHPKSEPGLIRRLSDVIPKESLVFLGNSLPIREWNLAATRETSHRRAFASRGANGIDGQIATFLGLASGEEEAWGLFGDLTALYDLNAPALLDQISTSRFRIVVINNGGGRIFSRLPSMAHLSEEAKQVTENHHPIRFRSWAEMWGLDYALWNPGETFPELGDSSTVVEVAVDQEKSEAFWSDWGS